MTQIDLDHIPDAAKWAAWAAVVGFFAKALHVSGRWVMGRLIEPVIADVVERVIQPKFDAMEKANASYRERTQFEWEAVVALQRTDHEMIRSIHQKLTGKLPDFPPRAD